MTIKTRMITVLTALCLIFGVGTGVTPPAEAVEVTDYVVGVQTFTASRVIAPVADRGAFTVVIYTPVVWPVAASSPISSGFGPRSRPWPEFHLGVDLTPGGGVPVHVVASGTVSFAACVGGGLGCHVVVEHSIDGVATQTTYGHMQQGSITVSPGQSVHWGDVVGLVGSTGASTGNHLHFEVHVNGVPVDPYAWIVLHATEEDW